MPSAFDSTAVAAAESLLRRWIGLDVDTIGRSALERAVRTRMDAVGMRDPAAFADRLEEDVAERDRLVEEIVVMESWFFRDPQVFDLIKRLATTRAGLPGRRPLRVLCVPCAAGEEPYSVAMTLLDAGVPTSRFTIDAVDVSRAGLTRAAAGSYFSNAFRNADLGFRDRWFRPEGAASRLDDAVRRTVTFSWGNVLDESFAVGREAYDVIFCRNLLIYLTAEARHRVERVLDGLLEPDGILVLGAAEPPILRGCWIPAGEHSSFALRRGPPATALPTMSASRSTRPATTGGPLASRPPRSRVSPPPPQPYRSEDGSRFDRQRHVPDDNALAQTADVVREAGRLANVGRHSEALHLCQLHERESGPTPEIFFLMAMLHQAAGDLDRAEGCLHKTLYLDPGHEEAILSLAIVASRRGDMAMAEHYRQSAARVLARKEAR